MGGDSWEGVSRFVGERGPSLSAWCLCHRVVAEVCNHDGQGATSTKRLENYASEPPLLLLTSQVLRAIISNKEPGSVEVAIG
jgi:hypothetical protein